MKGYFKYFRNKFFWFVVTLIFAFLLNFLLPRLMPGDPVAAITAKIAQGSTSIETVKEVYKEYEQLFGTDKPISQQFVLYVRNVFNGDFGTSFTQYPRKVSSIIGSSLGWTLALQLPAILVGWIIGNVLGALAAYVKKGWDKVVMPVAIFVNNLPAFGLAVIMLVIFAVQLKWFPTSGGYGFDLIPSFTPNFIKSVLVHYQLPFWTLVLIAIGGQAIGMRSMSIYELNADYVKYARFMGVPDGKIIGYVFRNAMLPQVTGLALALGTMVGGSLVAETIFSYPGLGSTILSAVMGSDYPLISAATLIVTMMVLAFNFLIEIIYGLIDPRIKAAQSD
ncbi:MAG TPA: ABC transporter permease [Anaerolineaceae bacterium]|nr:ABC transporter permease [Anaerolineaceae bacterium]HPT24383.1 ABC transporter permease [Anaerolineaceae bacterium]